MSTNTPLSSGNGAVDQDKVLEGMIFSKVKAGWKLSGVDPALTHLSIPESIDGINVVSVGKEACSGSANLVEVSIPNTVKIVGSYAFANCSA